MLYDWYCIIVIFCPNIIAFCSVKVDYFQKFYRIRHKNHYNQLKCIYE